MKVYVVINELDCDELAKFKTLKEAKQFILECKRFDLENGNPFQESYSIEVREE